jgi:hypothetical protein
MTSQRPRADVGVTPNGSASSDAHRWLTQALGAGDYRRDVLAIRALLTAAGVVLLLWAYVILDNIWNYNDSGTLTYVLYALAPALLGVLCMYLALRGWRRSAKRE